MTPADRERQIKGLLDYLPREKQIDALREMIEHGTVTDQTDKRIIRQRFLELTEPKKEDAA